MFATLATALVLSLATQSPAADRNLAEQLARSGRSVEALDLFERIVAENPTDYEARLWVARLQLRMGRTEEAEVTYRSVLLERPADIDARIGLGATLTRKGAWRDALAILLAAKDDAGENPDLFAALARAYRRAGDDRRALDYYRRALALSRADPDVIDGFEATAQVYGHSVALEGFGEGGASDAQSVSLAATVRLLPRLRVEGGARVQRRAGTSDALAGGGAVWRANRSTSLRFHAAGGTGNTSLPTAELTAAVVEYAGVFEIGGSIRRLEFVGVGVVAASPLLAWDPGGRWRLDGRYTYSRSSFDATGESSGDHSVLVRDTWRRWRRVALNAAYAYGIESFENLSADRLQSLGATTIAAGVGIRLPSLTHVAATWEHQWRSNDTRVERFTLSVVHSVP